MNETYSAGRALSLGFRLFFRNLIPFAILAAIVSLPFAAWAYFKFQNLEALVTDQYFQFKYIAMLGLTGVVIAAPLTYGVVMDLNGKRASLIDCIGMGIKRLFPVLGVGILLGLMLILIGFGLVLIAAAFQSAIIAVILIYGVLAMVYAIYYVAVLGAALIGLWPAMRLNAAVWMPLLLLIASFSAVHLVYWSNARMRAPVMPAVAVLAAGAFAGRAVRVSPHDA